MAQETAKSHAATVDGIVDANSGEIVDPRPVMLGLRRAELAEVSSFAEALALLGDEVEEATADNVGDGVVLLDKDDLVGNPFMVTGFAEKESADFGGFYLHINGITEGGTKFTITDGSKDAGLRVQLLDYRRRTGKTAVIARRGLISSVYDVRDDQGRLMLDDKGQPMKGKSYFIDLRKKV